MSVVLFLSIDPAVTNGVDEEYHHILNCFYACLKNIVLLRSVSFLRAISEISDSWLVSTNYTSLFLPTV